MSAEYDAIVSRALAMVEDRMREPGELLSSTNDAITAAKLRFGAELDEHFGVFYLDSRHRLIAFETPFVGTVDRCNVFLRPIARRCLELNAAAVVLAHNHPSGNADPSQSDLRITRQLQDVLKLLDVNVIDHVIVARNDAASLAARGLL